MPFSARILFCLINLAWSKLCKIRTFKIRLESLAGEVSANSRNSLPLHDFKYFSCATFVKSGAFVSITDISFDVERSAVHAMSSLIREGVQWSIMQVSVGGRWKHCTNARRQVRDDVLLVVYRYCKTKLFQLPFSFRKDIGRICALHLGCLGPW